MKKRPEMIVGGSYRVLRAVNGFKVGDRVTCVGADTKKPFGEFGMPKGSPKLKAAVWYFDWEDVECWLNTGHAPEEKG